MANIDYLAPLNLIQVPKKSIIKSGRQIWAMLSAKS